MVENQLVNKQTKKHVCELTERKYLKISGACDVISFDEGCIVLSTVDGVMSVDGSELRIVSLDVENGYVEISGSVNAMIYPEGLKKSGGFFRKKQK